MGVEVEFLARRGGDPVEQGAGVAGGSSVVLADVFEGFEEGRAETVVGAGKVAGEGGLDLGLGNSIWGCGRLVCAPWHLAGGRGEGGGDVEEDYVGGGRAVEECGECGRRGRCGRCDED